MKQMKNTKLVSPIAIPQAVDTGAMLKAFFKKRRTHQAALSRHIGIIARTLYSYRKNKTIQTSVLWRLCHGLQHHFYADIAAQLPSHFTTDAVADTTAATQIAQLEQQVLLLTAERDVLLKVAGGR